MLRIFIGLQTLHEPFC